MTLTPSTVKFASVASATAVVMPNGLFAASFWPSVPSEVRPSASLMEVTDSGSSALAIPCVCFHNKRHAFASTDQGSRQTFDGIKRPREPSQRVVAAVDIKTDWVIGILGTQRNSVCAK